MILANSIDDLALIFFEAKYLSTLVLNSCKFTLNSMKFDKKSAIGLSSVGILISSIKTDVRIDSSTFIDNLTT